MRSFPDVAKKYCYKKHVFELKSKVVIYFSREEYGDEKSHFRQIYENIKKSMLYGLTPTILSHDDKTMTLVVEKAQYDLERYFAINDKRQLLRMHKNVAGFFKNVWKKTKKHSSGLPRYVKAFIRLHQYQSQTGDKLENYLSTDTVKIYKKIQKVVRKFVNDLSKTHYERGFGTGDVKPANLVVAKGRKLLFIDVDKAEFNYHWLTLLGIYYQCTVESTPNSPFSKTLKQEITRVLHSYPQKDVGIKLFLLGRINCYLLPCTLWNIAFLKNVGKWIDEKGLRDKMGKVRLLTQIDKVEYAIAFASDAFEDNWQERLKDYPKTAEFKKYYGLLKKELDRQIKAPKGLRRPKAPAVFTFMGIPGSGKSTLSEMVHKLTGAVILRSDWIYFQKLINVIEGDYYKAYTYEFALAKYYLANDHSIIVDGNARTKATRTMLLDLAKWAKVPMFLLKINSDIDTAAKRVTLKGDGENVYEENVKRLKVFQ